MCVYIDLYTCSVCIRSIYNWLHEATTSMDVRQYTNQRLSCHRNTAVPEPKEYEIVTPIDQYQPGSALFQCSDLPTLDTLKAFFV